MLMKLLARADPAFDGPVILLQDVIAATASRLADRREVDRRTGGVDSPV